MRTKGRRPCGCWIRHCLAGAAPINIPRVWRCGNLSEASILIAKPKIYGWTASVVVKMPCVSSAARSLATSPPKTSCAAKGVEVSSPETSSTLMTDNDGKVCIFILCFASLAPKLHIQEKMPRWCSATAYFAFVLMAKALNFRSTTSWNPCCMIGKPRK